MWETLKSYFSEFKVLKNTPAEFWTLNLVINFCEMLAYFAFITVLTLYLTNDIGVSDQQAGNIVGYFTLLITLIIFVSGFIIDSIGVKKALLISMGILIPARLILGFGTDIDKMNLKDDLNFETTRAAIIEQGLDLSTFTKQNARFISAQVDLIQAYGTYEPDLAGEQETSFEEKLTNDSNTRRDAFMKAAEKSPAVQSRWGEKLVDEAKDVEVFKTIVLEMIKEKAELKNRYRIDLSDQSGKSDEQIQDDIITIVRLHPPLRPTSELPGFMKSLAGVSLVRQFFGSIGVLDQYPVYTYLDILKGLIFILLIITAFGEALMVPAIYAALRQYTNKRTSGTAFNFQYLTMNIGAVLSFVIFDLLRDNYGNESIILFGAAMAVICTIAALFLRANIEVKEDGSIVEHAPKTKEEREMPWTIALSVIKETAFWRFMLFISLLIGVKLTFTHQFLVMPKYYTRVLGDNASIGALNTINPAIITVGLILFIPIIMRFTVFRLIVVGTIVSSLSVFFLAIPGKFFTVLGWSIENGYLMLVLLQIIVFAFGELIWSPRLSEYTVTIAPKGREGTYMSMAALPMFIAKPLNGWLSGRLLTEYCPDGVMNDIVSGARSWYNGPEMMWIIFGVIAISSPILVIVLQKFIRADESRMQAANQEEEVVESSEEAPT